MFVHVSNWKCEQAFHNKGPQVDTFQVHLAGRRAPACGVHSEEAEDSVGPSAGGPWGCYTYLGDAAMPEIPFFFLAFPFGYIPLDVLTTSIFQVCPLPVPSACVLTCMPATS